MSRIDHADCLAAQGDPDFTADPAGDEYTATELDHMCAKHEAQDRGLVLYRLTADDARATYQAATSPEQALRQARMLGWTPAGEPNVEADGDYGTPQRHLLDALREKLGECDQLLKELYVDLGCVGALKPCDLLASAVIEVETLIAQRAWVSSAMKLPVPSNHTWVEKHRAALGLPPKPAA